MAIASPGVRITGPTCVPARYDLFSVAEIEDRTDVHWQAGFYHDQESCEDLTTRTITCASPVDPKSVDGSLTFPEGDAFVVIAPFECATAGLTLGEAWDHAEARLAQGEVRSVEQAFWVGQDELGNPIRASLGGDPDVVDVTPGAGAVSVTEGVSLLENWMAENSPCAPVLHASRRIAPYLTESHLVAPNGNIMYVTGTGSRVVVGSGYGITGPLGGGANEVQTVRVTPGAAPSGTFTLTFDGQTTGPIAYNASAAAIQTALEALSNVSPGDITASGGPVEAADVVLTFGGQYANEDVPQITADDTGLTDATAATGTTSEGEGLSTLPTPDGEAWMFVTGGVKILRGPTFLTPDRGDVPGAVNRVVNDITVFAERPYGVALGCGAAAVRVTLVP